MDYDLWSSLLPEHGSPPAESAVGAGFWRLPSSQGHARPVATWHEDGNWQVYRHGVDAFDETEKTKWFAFKEAAWPRLVAMSEASYEAAVTNNWWPDNVPVGPEPKVQPTIANPPLAGHNMPPVDNKLNELIDRLDQLVAEATKLAKAGEAKTQDQADVASNLKTRIRDLRQQIIATHDAEVAPLLAEERRIHAAYFAPRDRATALEKRLHEVVIRPFLMEQERRKIEAAKAAKEAKAAGQPVEPPADAPVSAGAKGRKTSLRTRWIGTITDFDAFYEAVKGHEQVQRFMAEHAQSIAANLHKIGATVDGLTIVEERV